MAIQLEEVNDLSAAIEAAKETTKKTIKSIGALRNAIFGDTIEIEEYTKDFCLYFHNSVIKSITYTEQDIIKIHGDITVPVGRCYSHDYTHEERHTPSWSEIDNKEECIEQYIREHLEEGVEVDD